VLEHVGHGHELDRAALRGQRIGRGAGAAPPAANQGKLDRVVLTRACTAGMATPARADAATARPVFPRNSGMVQILTLPTKVPSNSLG
jgi:hypothetical protein